MPPVRWKVKKKKIGGENAGYENDAKNGILNANANADADADILEKEKIPQSLSK